MKPNIEWDEQKARTNLRKHRIGFDEAATVLVDPFSITVLDPGHSADEQRYIDIGTSEKGRVLVVVYTERAANTRIVSSRKANPSERKAYEKGNQQ